MPTITISDARGVLRTIEDGAQHVSIQVAPTPEKFTTWVFGSADTPIDIAGSETLVAPSVDIYTMDWSSLGFLFQIATSTDVSVSAELVTDGSVTLDYGLTTVLANKAAGIHYADLSSLPYGHSLLLKAINNNATAGSINGALISRERLS